MSSPRRRSSAAHLAWFALSFLILGAAPAAHATENTLRVCADPNNLPFSNQRQQGLENRLAQLLASELGARLQYTWWPQRRGFIRNTLKAGKCDAVMGLPADFELADLTTPYYTSSYVFVTRKADGLGDLHSLDDPRLRKLRIGLHVIGDDYAGVPPATALGARGIVSNVVGYSIYGDYSRPDPPRELIDAVARGDVDVAVAWGPLAGYFAESAPVPLVVRAIDPGPDRFGGDPMRFAIAVGVRHGDAQLKQRLQAALDRRQSDVRSLLAEYHVPLVASAEPVAERDAAIAPSTGERLYVTNERSGELTVLDPVTRKPVATLRLGKRPRGLDVSPDGRRLYVALSGTPIGGPNVDESTLPPPDKSADGIGVVDLATLKLLTIHRGVSDPEQVAVSKDGRKLYVASEDTATAVVLDAFTGHVLATLTVGHEPEGVAASPDGRWVYVSSEAEDEITVVDARVDAVKAQIPTCARPRGIVFATRSARAYVSCENSGEIAVIDTNGQRELRRVPVPGLGARPMGLALSPDEHTLYVATGRGGTLVALGTARFHTLGTVSVGQRPWGISVSADGERIYTANGPSNDVSVVDARSFKVLQRVQVGAGPWGALAHDAARGRETSRSMASSENQGRGGSGTMR